MIARYQLLDLGVHPQAIKHRVASARLHPVATGVYAVGRPQLGDLGRSMAAVLSCGPRAALSHRAAALLWKLVPPNAARIEVTCPTDRRRPGILVHRRKLARRDLTRLYGIPVTTAVRTLVDVAGLLSPRALEAAVNEADKLDLVDPETLRTAVAQRRGQRGVRQLRRLLDRGTFALTDSELERRFLPLVRSAGLPQPRTGEWVNGFKVDFWWPDLGLIVETDGLRYHRTPAQQARDRLRDQTHTAAAFACLRFTHAQVRFEPQHVRRTLASVAGRRNGGRG